MLLKNKKSKIFLALALSALLLVVVAGGFLRSAAQPKTWKDILPKPEHTKVDERKPLREQTRLFEIAGRTFEIPIMYIDGRPKSGIKQDSMLLEVIWPEMRSTYELKDKTEYDRIRKEEHRLGWILLEPAAIRPSLDIQVANLRHFLAREDFVGSVEALEKHIWYHGTPTGPEPWSEVYLKRNDKNLITDFIECSRSKSARFPNCEHKFISGGLIYQAIYNESAFFPQWQQQKQRAIEFMHNHEINHTKGDQ